VRPAFGFWLFPLELLGRPLEEASGLPPDGDVSARGEQDWSRHWPELALASLPAAPPEPEAPPARRRKRIAKAVRSALMNGVRGGQGWRMFLPILYSLLRSSIVFCMSNCVNILTLARLGINIMLFLIFWSISSKNRVDLRVAGYLI
jgi:hypothetical protein